MKLSGRKFFQPLRSAWNPPIGDALKTCALVSPGSRRLTSIYIKSLRTCRLHGGDLCAEMFRKSALQPPVRPFSQKPSRTSFSDRCVLLGLPGPPGPIGFFNRCDGVGRPQRDLDATRKSPAPYPASSFRGGDGANCEKSTGYFILYETTSLLT